MSFASVFLPFAPAPPRGRPARLTSAVRKWFALCSLALAGCLAAARLSAQTPGTLDTNFTSSITGGTVFAVATEVIDQNELIVAGGDEDNFGELYLDGVADLHFELPDFGNAARLVYTIVPQILTDEADQDKTLVGGLFGMTPNDIDDGEAGLTQNILRLNSDGSFDTTFNPGYGANNYVTSIVPESNGSMYVGGLFDAFDRIPHQHVVRLNQDGSIDNTFSSALSINDAVLSMANQMDPLTGQPNGQLLIVGTFNNVDGDNTAKIARLNNDGSLDTTFKPVIATRVLTVLGLANGQILIGGSFNSVNGKPVNNIARLNKDGSLDTTYLGNIETIPPGSPDPLAVYTFKQLPDTRMYVGGNFYSVNGVKREFFARLMPDGSLDTTFDPGSNIINEVQSIAIQSNNKVLVGETVSRKINDVFPASLVRLYSDDPPLPPAVTVTASRANAVEDGPGGKTSPGQFELVRVASDLSKSLTVYFTISGSAVEGVDYKDIRAHHYSDTIYERTFAPTKSSLTIGVKPTGHTLSSSPETVTLTLVPHQDSGPFYTVGSPATATVNISEH